MSVSLTVNMQWQLERSRCDGPVEDGRVQLLVPNLESDAVLAGGKTKNIKVRRVKAGSS